MIQTVTSTAEDRPLQDPSPRSGFEWIRGSEPLAVCFSCDATLPADTAKCPACDCEMSIVRRCPSCRRVLSAQHDHCIYCSLSFLRRGFSIFRALPIPIVRRHLSRPSVRYGGVVVESTMILALMLLSVFFAYSYFWRYPRVERSASAAEKSATTRSVASDRSARRARTQRAAPPRSRETISEPETLPLPTPPPLQFTVEGGYDPPPLPHRNN